MQLKTYKDYKTLSQHAATEIVAMVKGKRSAVLCFASGDTPRLAYSLLSETAVKENADFSQCVFIGLDEWVGIPAENEGSCSFFLQTTVFKPLNIDSGKIHLFNALSGNLAEECKKMDKIIFEKGGIDLMIVGVGMNGHIGFNEPGIPPDKYSHVINLDNTTQTIGQKYFKQPVLLKQGITLGLKHLMEAKNVILMANGIKKADVIKKAVEEKVNNSMPASIMQTHPAGIVMIDEEAGSLLNKKSQQVSQ
jgi:glucosamine-6-phosphate isomerase